MTPWSGFPPGELLVLVGLVEIEDMLEKEEAGELTGSGFFPLS